MARVTVNQSGSKKTALIVDKNMTSHADDPFFVKKAKQAESLIRKYGVPKAAKDKQVSAFVARL